MLFIERTTVVRWENSTRMPDVQMIARVAELLEVDAGSLLTSAAEPDEKPNVILVDDEKIILTGGLPVLKQSLPDAVVTAARDYFSASTLTTQSVYTLQLTRDDLDHLAAASGVLFRQADGERVRLGDMGQSTVDWSTGLVFSMFDGAWPTLSGTPVCAERLYTQPGGGVRFAIPARINGLEMYLLAVRDVDGSARVLGATQGYDEDGMAIRGSIPLEAGMTVEPLYTALDGEGHRREWAGEAIAVPPEGLTLVWQPLPPGNYEYALALTDLTGKVQYTQGVTYPVG